MQVTVDHPLAKFGHHRLPGWLWRRSKMLHEIVRRARDMWLVASGRCSLHVAWQTGHDDGTRQEYRRIVVYGGDIAGKVWSREHKMLVPDIRQKLTIAS